MVEILRSGRLSRILRSGEDAWEFLAVGFPFELIKGQHFGPLLRSPLRRQLQATLHTADRRGGILGNVFHALSAMKQLNDLRRYLVREPLVPAQKRSAFGKSLAACGTRGSSLSVKRLQRLSAIAHIPYCARMIIMRLICLLSAARACMVLMLQPYLQYDFPFVLLHLFDLRVFQFSVILLYTLAWTSVSPPECFLSNYTLSVCESFVFSFCKTYPKLLLYRAQKRGYTFAKRNPANRLVAGFSWYARCDSNA